MTIQDIAKVLVEKNKLSQTDAEAFVTAIFNVVEAGIKRDKLVKIKGLGSFKVVTVDARESVNVNTGERVIIDSHDKISFTPDSMMKELVNKPFSSFETVVLNEGVEFDDMPVQDDNEQAEETATTEEAPDTVAQEDVVAAETTPEVTQPEEEKKEVIRTEEEPEKNVETDASEPEEEKPAAISFEENMETHKAETTGRSPLWQWIAMSVVCLCIGFAAGFYTHQKVYVNSGESLSPNSSPIKEGSMYAQTDTTAQYMMLTDTTAQGVTPKDTTTQGVTTKDTTGQDVTPPAETTISLTHQGEDGSEAIEKGQDVDYLKYDAMDARVENGAYYIIGTQSVVQAREGDNVAKLSRRYLGEGMSCYVEVYNGVKESTQLNAGQEVKIPKLITKKAFKARLKRQQQKQKENQQ